MANMSASILRQLVGEQFKINPEKVILSGLISPTQSFTGNSCWSSQTDCQYYRLFGFSTENGFEDLKNYVGDWSNGQDGKQRGNDGTPLGEIPEVDKYIFFVVEDDFRSGNGDDYSEYSLSVFKAPNFKEHWAKINSEDLTRWESWLESK